ncbi:helix-turn-helix domain-containing protein [Streptomyces sp. NPDC006285]|uniref:helix-turn-helix domain-containing protein n=1 Tax=Streptomyces sp. NPDC006285 TaxID=3364742 RepID=UPI0036D1DE98
MPFRDGTRPFAGGDDECGGTVSTRDDDVEEFAALLRRLKARTDRSYGALARRVHMNTSTLHRYCAGDAVPLDFAPVERFAALCGATPAERLELHRLWILAVAARQRPRTPTGPAPDTPEDARPPEEAAQGESEPQPPASDTPDPHPPTEPVSAAAPEPVTAPAPAPVNDPRVGVRAGVGARLRRRRVAVAVAVVSALLATLGGLSALSGDGSSDDASRTVEPSPTTSATSGGRHGPSTSPSPGRTGPSSSAGTGGGASASPGDGRSGAPSKNPKDPKGAEDTGGTKPKGGGSGAVPLTWTANSQAWKLGCGHDYVIRKDPRQVPPPPAPQDAGTWAATQGAVHGQETNVEISVQGRTSTAVVLTALRVRVVGRTAPVPGTVYSMDQGCGGAVTPRSFAVDLDKDRPIARSVPGNDTGTPIPAVRMPYRVSAEDPEVLLVTARTQTCGCAWYLELDWSSEGRTGTVRIDDGGRPFRTSSIKGLPRYWYASEGAERKWVLAD